MFNAKRIETIRKNVQISTLLSDHEKSDWLNLLELMNDKQLGELEEILASDPNVVKAMQSQPAQSVQQQSSQPAQRSPQQQTEFVQHLPPLSHIANMPTDVTMTHSVPATPAAASTPRAAQPLQSTPQQPLSQQPPQSPPQPLPRTIPSPNLTSFPPKPNYVKPAPGSATGAQRVVAQAPASPQIPHAAKPATAQPQPQPSKTTQPKPTKPLTVFSIKQAEELQQLTLESIRAHTYQSIFDVIRQTIQTNGYFAVLQLIEASPLYASYINAGKQRLGAAVVPAPGEAQQQSTLTQEEFEFMTDLLRNMRFNRW